MLLQVLATVFSVTLLHVCTVQQGAESERGPDLVLGLKLSLAKKTKLFDGGVICGPVAVAALAAAHVPHAAALHAAGGAAAALHVAAGAHGAGAAVAGAQAAGAAVSGAHGAGFAVKQCLEICGALGGMCAAGYYGICRGRSSDSD